MKIDAYITPTTIKIDDFELPLRPQPIFWQERINSVKKKYKQGIETITIHCDLLETVTVFNVFILQALYGKKIGSYCKV